MKVGRSVGQKEKMNEHMKGSECQWRPGCWVRKLGCVVLSLVIRWYNRNRTTKCLNRLHKRSIDDNLRQLVLIRQDCVLVNLSAGFFTSDSQFFFYFSKKWVGRAMGNETFYGDGLMNRRQNTYLLLNCYLDVFRQWPKLFCRFDLSEENSLFKAGRNCLFNANKQMATSFKW